MIGIPRSKLLICLIIDIASFTLILVISITSIITPLLLILLNSLQQGHIIRSDTLFEKLVSANLVPNAVIGPNALLLDRIVPPKPVIIIILLNVNIIIIQRHRQTLPYMLTLWYTLMMINNLHQIICILLIQILLVQIL